MRRAPFGVPFAFWGAVEALSRDAGTFASWMQLGEIVRQITVRKPLAGR